MSIPASNLVKVTPRVISAGGTELEFDGLFLTKNPLCVFPGAMSFSSATMVGDYFGEASAEYQVAQEYFLGYNNSFKKPRAILFARAATEAIAAELIGAAAPSLSDMKEISDGSMSVTIDSTTHELSNLNFSTAETQSDVASAIQQAITSDSGNATVAYSSQTGGFIITSGTTGDSSSVEFATGETAEALGLSESSGATISNGSAALTPSGLMNSITNQTQNFVPFTTIYEADAEEVLGYCDWANSMDVEYLYVPWTTNAADKVKANASNLPNQILSANTGGVALVFGGVDYSAFIASITASIDWNRRNGMPTYKFKSQDGLAPSVTDASDAESLNSMNVNYYGKYATRADEFNLLAEGKMMCGNFTFIDEFIAMVWLKNTIQLACVNGFASVDRVPYNEAGYTLIRSWCSDPITRAKQNGVIQAGVSLSQSQIAQLYNEIGKDVSSQIQTNGYYLMVSDPGASARVNRDSPSIGLWFTYGGAVHRLDIPLTLIQ